MSEIAPGSRGDAERLLGEALAHFQARRLAEAEALLQRVGPALGGRTDYQLLCANLHRARGRAQDALRHYREALALEPRSVTARLALASLLFSLGQRGKVRTELETAEDRKSTRLNSSHLGNSYAVFCLKNKKSEGFSRSVRMNLLNDLLKSSPLVVWRTLTELPQSVR